MQSNKNSLILAAEKLRLYKALIALNFCSHPSLRVAYIDEIEESEGGKPHKVYYSVLVKAVDNLDQVIIF